MSEIDLVHYEGREQAYIKHCLLNKYLSSWGFKIGSKWDPLVFIDGFAGPWGSLDKDFADASFGIAINALANAIFGLEKIGRSINAACIFVEKAPQPFSKLEAFAKKHSSSRVQAIALRGRFSENIGTIEDYLKTLGPNAFKFVFLDQKGGLQHPSRSCDHLYKREAEFWSRLKREFVITWFSLLTVSTALRSLSRLSAKQIERKIRFGTQLIPSNRSIHYFHLAMKLQNR
jgi:three-Cys-motif partner protein